MDLWEALRSHNLSAVEDALQEDTGTLHVRTSWGYTPLRFAAQEFPQAVPALLAAGALTEDDAEEAQEQGAEALRLAADLDHRLPEDTQAAADALEALLHAGVDPNRRGRWGMAPLHCAASATPLMPPISERLITLLLDYGADPNLLTEQEGSVRVSPLDLAFRCGNPGGVRALRRAGGRLHAMVKEPQDIAASELNLAVLEGDLGALETALDRTGGDTSGADRLGRTALHVAALIGDIRIVRLLLDRGASVHARMGANVPHRGWIQGVGEQPLHLAAWAGHREIVRLLIAAGADPEAPGAYPRGRPPLIVAILGAAANDRDRASGHETMQELLSRGASPTAREQSWNRWKAYQQAVHGASSIHESLAERSGTGVASLSAPDTPLTYATASGTPEEIALLIQAGAGADRRELLKAIRIALRYRKKENAAILKEIGERAEPPLRSAEQKALKRRIVARTRPKRLPKRVVKRSYDTSCHPSSRS